MLVKFIGESPQSWPKIVIHGKSRTSFYMLKNADLETAAIITYIAYLAISLSDLSEFTMK